MNARATAAACFDTPSGWCRAALVAVLRASVLILAILAAAPTSARDTYAVEVFASDFEGGADANFDRWPDGWTRKRGPEYPHYLEIELAPVPPPQEGRALVVRLNGGAAAVHSPAVAISPDFTYVLDGLIQTEGLKHDRAYVTLTILDAENRVLDTYESERLTGTAAWTRVRIGPVASDHPNARGAIIGLHVEAGDSQDLTGSVWFDDLWLGRLPRMQLATSVPLGMYESTGEVELRCEITGLADPDWKVELRLEDARDELVDHQALIVSETNSTPAAQVVRRDLESGKKHYSSEVVWRPRLSEVGFYRLHAELQGKQGPVVERELSLAVIRREPQRASGEFGWSLPRGDEPLPIPVLAQLLGQVGINWVKFPLWHDVNDAARVNDLIWFTERMRAQGITVVGLLHEPPPAVRAQFGRSMALDAADLFTTPSEVWFPSLETVLLRSSINVRRWQLGADLDQSFVGFSGLEKKISDLKEMMDTVGHDVQLGFGWNWTYEQPASPDVPWRFLSLSAQPSLTAEELRAYLSLPRNPRVARFVVLEPLDRRQYTNDVRAADLVERMMAAKRAGVEAMFVPEPISTVRGLLNDDGTPGELLLPWRTTAIALAGTEYLGQMSLPGGSSNDVFVRHGEAVMVAWNPRTSREQIYLGEKVEQRDIWGRACTPEAAQGEQIIDVGPLPTFITGMNEPVARWRHSVDFGRRQLPSVFGKLHEQTLRFKNFFPGGAGGRVTIVAPPEWVVTPHNFDIELGAGEEIELPLTILFSSDANSGPQQVRIDFEVNADRPYKFSSYRRLDVGLGDISIELTSELLPNGDLEVQQRLTNATDEAVSFTCSLFAPQRRRIRRQVLHLYRGTDVTTYRIENGQALIGQMLWLRADEIGGSRSLNYHFRAQE